MNIYEKLTSSSIFHRAETVWLLGGFVFLRVISLALFEHPIIQAILAFAILLIFAALYFQNEDWAWMVLLGELFLGGAGHFLEIFGLSLRTLLVFTFAFLWTAHHIGVRGMTYGLRIKHNIFYAIIPLAVFITIGVALGIARGHGLQAVISDAVPFAYLGLLLPLYYHFHERNLQEFLTRLLLVLIIGSALFSLITFLIYSTGIGELQDFYYHWYRDVAMGKITDMGFGFFRIVVPEHLIMVPATLLIASLLMRDEMHHKLWRVFLGLSLFVLALNLSRTYMLALLVGFLVLKFRHSLKRWLTVSATAAIIFISLFVGTSLVASVGQTTGLELLGLRATSIVRPTQERSAVTRTHLLTPIFAHIRSNPILGTGLGESISFTDPYDYKPVTTRQFDWGYLELVAELGILGALSYLLLLFLATTELTAKIRQLNDYHDFYVGILAGLVSLMVMTVTSPALFHVLGILLLVFVLTITMKPITIYDSVILHLYRVFHKLK